MGTRPRHAKSDIDLCYASPMLRRHVAGPLIALLALLVAAACAPGRGVESALVIADIGAGTGPSLYKRLTDPPQREAFAWRIEERAGSGDLYRPAGGHRAALVLVPGAAPRGKDDPRLVAFAATLGRAGFLVLVPELANVRALRLAPSDARAVADAVRAVGDIAEGKQLGLAGISYAVGPAVLAAREPDIAGRVAFILGIGGYHDSVATIRFFTTGHYRLAGEPGWRRLEPNAYGKWVFVRANADLLEEERDRATLHAIADRKLDDLEAGIGDLVAALGPEGASVLALVENRDPERVAALVRALPGRIRDDIAGLDLSPLDLKTLAARLILVHGRDDRIIPFSESVALAAAAAPGRADLHLLDRLVHVDVGAVGVADAWRLWNAAYSVLGTRE
jgi:hypothetical protein